MDRQTISMDIHGNFEKKNIDTDLPQALKAM